MDSKKTNNKKKKQRTLGAFGFTKSVSHQGEKVQLKLPDFSGPEAAKSISCAHCPQKFKNNQGYAVHLKCINHDKEELVKTLPINTFKDKKEDIRATVLSVMEKLVSNVEEAIIEGDTKAEKTISNRRGRGRRGKYTVLFKAKVISDVQPEVLQEQLAEKYCINQSLISKWLRDKNKILKEASEKNRKNLTKMRRGTKYRELYNVLLQEVKVARSKGYVVGFNWIWNRARKVYREQQKNPDANVRKHVITTFLRQFNVRMRARQRNRKYPKEHYRKDLMNWHGLTRERLIRTGT